MQFHENLHQCVDRALSEAARQSGRPLDVVSVFLSGTQAPLDDWQTRLVGNEDITVLAAPPGTHLHMLYTMSVESSELKRRLSAVERGQAPPAQRSCANAPGRFRRSTTRAFMQLL